MQVEMPLLNSPKERAAFARSSAWRFSLSMIVVLACCLSAAQAQTEASAGGAAPVEQTRSRRVAETTNTTGNEAAKSETGESVDDPPLTIEKGSDRLSTLRVQIEAAKSDAERTRLQRVLVDYLVALGKRSEAVSELRVMSREDRLDPIGFYNIGNALARLGDTDTAIDAYRKAIKQRHGNYSRALNNLGVMFMRQGRWDEAQVEFASALRLENFRYGEASYNLGRVHSARGEAALAIREWSRALAVQPDHVDAAIALARAYAEDGSPERGIEVLDAFVARRGPSAEMMDARREILFSSGTGEGAKSSFNPSNASRDGSNGRAMLNASSGSIAGKASNGKNDDGRRAAASLRSLTVDRETYDLLQRARAARESGRNEDAVTFYRRVLARNNSFFPPANLELGFVLSSLKRHEEAAEALALVAKREGARYPIAYYHLGREYELLNRLNLAAEAFERATAAYGDTNPQFFLDLSRVREKEGNAQAALTAMENYVRISQSLGHVPDWSAKRLAELRQKATKK